MFCQGDDQLRLPYRTLEPSSGSNVITRRDRPGHADLRPHTNPLEQGGGSRASRKQRKASRRFRHPLLFLLLCVLLLLFLLFLLHDLLLLLPPHSFSSPSSFCVLPLLFLLLFLLLLLILLLLLLLLFLVPLPALLVDFLLLFQVESFDHSFSEIRSESSVGEAAQSLERV